VFFIDCSIAKAHRAATGVKVGNWRKRLAPPAKVTVGEADKPYNSKEIHQRTAEQGLIAVISTQLNANL